MKFTALVTGLVLALPLVVFGASIPGGAAIDIQARAPDGDARGYTELQVRALGDIQVFDKRQTAGQIEGATAIIGAVAGIVEVILEGINRDNKGRGEFTQAVVTENYNTWPDYNWVCIHTKHTMQFDGVQGTNWDHYHREYDIQIGGTIGFEIYWFESGTFERQGDGGFQNWAYIGNVVSTSNNGATVVFA